MIANLAWATALTTTGPWYGPSVGLAVYSVALLLGAFLALVLVREATARVARLDASLVRLDRRIALLRVSRGPPGRRSVHSDSEDPDVLRGGLADGGSPSLAQAEKEGHDALVPLLPEQRSRQGNARTELLRQLVRERIAIRESRGRVWTTAAGPLLACVAFLAIAGPMLPGSEGFAAAHYVLNTTLILFLSYGFAPLVAWSVVALGMMGSLPGGAPA